MSQSPSDDRLRFTQGGGWRILIGVVATLFGILWLVIATVFITQGMGGLEALGLLVFGMVLAGAGLFNIFWRSGVDLDRQAGTVTFWSRVVVPLRHKVYSLDDFDHVTINRELRNNAPATQASYMVYPVALASTAGNALPIQQPRKVNQARQAGRQLAEYLGFPLVDRSQDPPAVYAADELADASETS